MSQRFVILPVLMALFIFSTFEPGRCTDTGAFIEKTARGTINWSRGVIQVQGVKAPADKSLGKSIDRVEVLAAAKDAARQNLLGMIKELRVNSSLVVGNVFAGNDVVLAKIDEMVNEAQVVKKAYLSDGTVQVTLEMNLRGGFSQLVLPDEIKQIQSIKTVSLGKSTSAPAGEASVSVSAPAIYTGLLVDARGLKLNPSMYPKIYDESGKEVYGSAFASREFAVQQGMIRYGKGFEAAMHLKRVADQPLVVKGLRTTQPGHTDLIISNADAAKIRRSSEHLSFLKRCRVLIVVE
jgi:hypothetical protein